MSLFFHCIWSLPPPPPHIIIINTTAAAAATTIKTQTCNLYSLFRSRNSVLLFSRQFKFCFRNASCSINGFAWKRDSSFSISLLFHCQKPHNRRFMQYKMLLWNREMQCHHHQQSIAIQLKHGRRSSSAQTAVQIRSELCRNTAAGCHRHRHHWSHFVGDLYYYLLSLTVHFKCDFNLTRCTKLLKKKWTDSQSVSSNSTWKKAAAK